MKEGSMTGQAENQLLARIGPGTPMGALFRSFWLPVLMASELPDPDGPPLRLRVLSEDLIAFRDSRGQVGLLGNHCPHRGASLFFGRNEEQGLRCVYHGWKFEVSGQCVDMPNEPPESSFKQKIRQTAYPCREQGGAIWAYLGPRAEPPPLPHLEWTLLPDSHRVFGTSQRECNWLQAMEGDLDNAHTTMLHGRLALEPGETVASWLAEPGKAPRLEVVPTAYGAM